jgi:hypothetical protein
MAEKGKQPDIIYEGTTEERWLSLPTREQLLNLTQSSPDQDDTQDPPAYAYLDEEHVSTAPSSSVRDPVPCPVTSRPYRATTQAPVESIRYLHTSETLHHQSNNISDPGELSASDWQLVMKNNKLLHGYYIREDNQDVIRARYPGEGFSQRLMIRWNNISSVSDQQSAYLAGSGAYPASRHA